MKRTLIPNYCHPSGKKTAAMEPSESSVRYGAVHPSIVGRQLSAWFLNKSRTERWVAKSSRQLHLLYLISLKSPNKSSRRRWIISREMSICFRIRIPNELTITANSKPVHTQTHTLNPWLIHFKHPGEFEAGKKDS